MKTIGLLGGMSWESSLEYYRLINEFTKDIVGKTHSAEIIMHSFDFHVVEKLQHDGKWDELTKLLIEKSRNLKRSGADVIVICTNTMHMMAKDIQEEVGIKVFHIAEATGTRILQDNNKKVLLLGTKFTMQGSFYKEKLNEMGIEVVVPNHKDQEIIHNVIYNELILGEFKKGSKDKYVDIINVAVNEGVQGVILGCTEIPLLIKEDDVDIDVYDTMTIHSEEVVKFANKENKS